MKTRSSIIQKVFCFFLLAALTLGVCTPALAASGTTTLTTKVPSCFTVDIHITGNGTITVNGTVLSQSGTVQVERNKQVTIQITAANNSYLKAVNYNGEDFTKDAADGSIMLPAIEDNAVLSVFFAAKSVAPATGDNSNIHFWAALFFVSCGVLIVFTVYDKKRKAARS